MKRALSTIAVAILAVSGSMSRAAEWGDLKAKFIYDGDVPAAIPVVPDKDAEFCGKFEIFDEELVVNKTNKGIADVVAYMVTRDSPTPPIHPDYAAQANAKVVLDNLGCRFTPHVTLLTTTQTLVLKNSDDVAHNTSYGGFRNPGFNDLIPIGGQLEKQLTVGGERAVVSCGIHKWMKAYVVVQDTPYNGVSNKDGELLIKNIPAGKWTFQLWHAGKGGYLAQVKQNGKATEWKSGRLEMTIKPGVNDLGEILFKIDEKK